MIRLSLALLCWFAAFFRSRHYLGLEIVVLRQQVGVLKRKNPRPATLLESMVRGFGDRQAGDGDKVASERIPAVLARSLSSRPEWPP
jgi:hypothetical protein